MPLGSLPHSFHDLIRKKVRRVFARVCDGGVGGEQDHCEDRGASSLAQCPHTTKTHRTYSVSPARLPVFAFSSCWLLSAQTPADADTGTATAVLIGSLAEEGLGQGDTGWGSYGPDSPIDEGTDCTVWTRAWLRMPILRPQLMIIKPQAPFRQTKTIIWIQDIFATFSIYIFFFSQSPLAVCPVCEWTITQNVAKRFVHHQNVATAEFGLGLNCILFLPVNNII